MLTTNIDIADRLINGQMGTVIKIALNEKTQKPNIVYIKFDDIRLCMYCKQGSRFKIEKSSC